MDMFHLQQQGGTAVKVELSRAYRMFVGLPASYTQREVTPFAPAKMLLSRSVIDFLDAQREGLGHPRSGPLFGYRQENGDLNIRIARCGQALTALPSTAPFMVDSSYILGLSDGLRAVDDALEWVGHWLVLGSTERPTKAEQKRLITGAAREGLANHHTPLLIVGWDGFESWMQAATWNADAEPVEVEVVLEGKKRP
ncbi:hypothetical protein [Deinococcus sp. PESE-13]